MLFRSNAKYLAHLPHQTQKIPRFRYGICAKIIPFVSAPLQICNDTDTNGKPKYCFFIRSLFSLLGFIFLSLFSHSLFSHQTHSLFPHQTQLLPQQRKNKMTHSTSSNNKLQGKVAIIIGGASGMGEATPVIATLISLISLLFLVVGCFDCWWLADFGLWW